MIGPLILVIFKTATNGMADTDTRDNIHPMTDAHHGYT
jgi:hypothetical protein